MELKMAEKPKFVDILEQRKKENPLKFMSKVWIPHSIRHLDRYYDPQEIKEIVANSTYMDSVIESLSSQTGVSQEKLRKEMLEYLEEIGFNRKMWVSRWLGVVFLKLTSIMKVGVFVNERSIDQLKKSLGEHPVLLLPTHKSYADFCLTPYCFYHYDMEIPVIAAGLDFYKMAIMGQVLRDSGAFYIRRTLSGNDLYAHTLKHYARNVVSKYNAPFQFFVEGTRSRSNKCLPPKYGMLSWALLPLFSGEVPDITIALMNISYERLMEHGLYAYEHLGVPKPKEALGALLKSLNSLYDNYGNVYMNMASPFSVKKYFKDLKYNVYESNKPLDLQKLTTEQLELVNDLGDRIVALQQEHTIVTITSVVAILLMDSLVRGKPQNIEDIQKGIEGMVEELEKLGVKTDLGGDVHSSLQRILLVHKKMMKVDLDNNLRLLSTELLSPPSEIKNIMKGHMLARETMVDAVPVIELQVYVNPVMYFLVPPALVTAIAGRGAARDELQADYHQLRKLLKQEFFYFEADDHEKFESALRYCLENELVSQSGDTFTAGGNERMRFLMTWATWPALTSIATCAEIFNEKKICGHNEALKMIQQRVEERQYHPYCLSLEATANCIQGLAIAGAITKKIDNQSRDIIYKVNPSTMDQCCRLIRSVLPVLKVDFSRNNPVIDLRLSPCRL